MLGSLINFNFFGPRWGRPSQGCGEGKRVAGLMEGLVEKTSISVEGEAAAVLRFAGNSTLDRG